jgi:hypothetical protein
MARKLVFFLVAGLVVAPAASAKGPHAVITSGPEAVQAGRVWVASVELNEFRRQPHPLVFATQGDRRVTAKLRRVPASMVGADGFKLRMVFPTEGRWRLAVVEGKRHFPFPAIRVGSGDAPQDSVSFPKGSEAVDASGSGDPLPPETVTVAKPSDDGGGLPLWIPALGLALAGAGVGLGVANRR